MVLTTGEQNVTPLLIILNIDLHYTELLYTANFKIKKWNPGEIRRFN